MLRHGLDALDLVRVRHVESLDTAVVHDAPELDHALLVGCDEAVQVGETVDTNKWVVMAFESDDRLA